MKNIIRTLQQQNYEINIIDEKSVIEAKDQYLKIAVIKNVGDKTYMLRIADRKFFDRWCNSGEDFIYNNESEIIEHLNNYRKCLKTALNEYIDTILDDYIYFNNKECISKTINTLYNIIKGEN